MAKDVRRLQGMIGNPTKKELAGIVREKLIANCPVTVQDFHKANRIFGPDLANLMGKTTRKKRSTFGGTMSKSPGTLLICTSM